MYDIFLDKLPNIDLHGYDIESARVKTNDFVEEAMALKYQQIVIIHGIGTGAVKKSVHDTLFATMSGYVKYSHLGKDRKQVSVNETR